MKSLDHRVGLLVLGILLAGCAPPREVVDVASDDAPEEAEVLSVEQDTLRPPVTEEARPAAVPERTIDASEIPAFHSGRMWTFHAPPVEYFENRYDFRPDSSWLSTAQRGALRFSTYCTASFVSPNGLILTNHHCARESISQVAGVDEGLLDEGFYAENLSDERPVSELYVEQLVGIEDVSAEVLGAAANVRGPGPKAEARRKRADAIERRTNTRLAEQDSTLRAEVVEFYSGAEYWTYVYRRYDDVRLVMAPELEMGYFGGDPDNFTYPRYTLDFSFFRVYDHAGEPLMPDSWFRWSPNGAGEGEVVFTVGNPGSTTRLNTIEMLEYLRDVDLPRSLDALRQRRDLLAEVVEEFQAQADSFDLRNDLMQIENTIKAQTGQLGGLKRGEILELRGTVLAYVRQQIQADDSLKAMYSSVIRDIALVQSSKKASAEKAAAFTHFLNPSASSHILARGMYGYVYTLLRQRGAPADQLAEIRKEALRIPDWPRELEKRMIEMRLEDLRGYLGDSDPTMKRLLSGLTPATLADSVVTYTSIADSAGFAEILDENYLASDDVTVSLIEAIGPLYFTLDQQLSGFVERESLLLGRLAQAQFAVFGEDLPPDATFTLRLSDGIIAGYQYEGIEAPPFTTYRGMYDRAELFAGMEPWELADRWKTPPESLNLDTPLNLVSTNDISGGSSGSALLNKDLEIVGVAFDGNLESLANEYFFRDESGRTISVDSRGIVEILGSVYSADRVLQELLTGQLFEEDAQAELAGN